jgi:predicted lipid-binding transport protein (Tim44 family)
MTFVRASGAGGGAVYVTVEFESNYTETYNGKSQSYYMREHWTLSRAQGVKSRTPDRTRVFGCPSCGAPQDQVFGGQCRYCKQQVATGKFDWLVTGVQIFEREARAPMLTGTTEEQGTDLETIVDPRAPAAFQALTQRDPAQNWNVFLQRVNVVFNEFQVAWTARDLLRMRALLSDTLFQTQTYWMKAYEKASLWNVIERPRINHAELARVTQDKFYDAITVRVFATSVDYTIDAQKRVVGGNRNRERHYSEYWTFIRGTQRRGPPRTDLGCPNCGAPLKCNMAGACTHCNAKVSTGDFDWVLSRIEQDEVYS